MVIRMFLSNGIKMNPSIKREIACLKRLGEKVEVIDNVIIIHNKLVPNYIADTFVARIKKADIKNDYKVIIKPA